MAANGLIEMNSNNYRQMYGWMSKRRMPAQLHSGSSAKSILRCQHVPEPSSSSLVTVPQPSQEHLLPWCLRTGEQTGHGIPDALQHPPRSLRRFRIRLEPVPAAQVLECQALVLSFFDLLPDPGKRSLGSLLGLLRTDHRLISSGVLLR